METITDRSFFKGKVAWLILILIALVAFAMVALPVWMIQPFRPQSQRGLEISYALRRWSPMLTIISLALVIMLLLWLWRVSRGWWRKALLVVIVIPLLAATWFARQNHFEWMFNPLANASYAKATTPKFVSDGDIVMTVEKNGEAAAYPIRLMAYHHLVQDTVGGTPIVATY
jgi:phosphoglycerol transferase MdoB-like AlkP superfamily enzyme